VGDPLTNGCLKEINTRFAADPCAADGRGTDHVPPALVSGLCSLSITSPAEGFSAAASSGRVAGPVAPVAW